MRSPLSCFLFSPATCLLPVLGSPQPNTQDRAVGAATSTGDPVTSAPVRARLGRLVAVSALFAATAVLPGSPAQATTVAVPLPAPHRSVSAVFPDINVTPSTTTIHVVLPTFAPALDTPGLAWHIDDATLSFTGPVANGATSFDITPDPAIAAGSGSGTYQLTVRGGTGGFNPTTSDGLGLGLNLTWDVTPGPSTVTADLSLSNALPGQHQTQYLYDVVAPKPVATAGSTQDLVGPAGFWTTGPEGTWNSSTVVDGGLDFTQCADCYDTYQPTTQISRSADGTTLHFGIPAVLFAGRLLGLDFVQVAGGAPGSNNPDVVVNIHVALSGGLQRLIQRSPVAIGGVHAVGVRQVASPGTWRPAVAGGWGPDPATFTYQWYRNGVAIPKATARTYVPVAADFGKFLTVRVRAHQQGYLDGQGISARVKLALHAPLRATSSPTMSGVARTGKKLSVSHGSWSPTATAYRYQWLRDGRPVAGATRSTLVLSAAWKGHRVSVTVTAIRAGYAPGSRTTAWKLVA